MEQGIVIERLIKLETLVDNFRIQQGRLEGRMVSEERTRAEQKKDIVETFEGVRTQYIQMFVEVDRLKIESERKNKAHQNMVGLMIVLIGAVASMGLKIIYDMITK